jgi:WD40 repeat protein
MSSRILQQIVVGTYLFGMVLGGACHIAYADPQTPAPSGDKPPADPALKKEGDTLLRLRFTAAEKRPNQPADIDWPVFLHAKEGCLFFSPDSDTLYVQRVTRDPGPPNPFGVGVALGKGGPKIMPLEPLGFWSVADEKRVMEIAGAQAAVLSPDGKTIGLAGMFKNKKGGIARIARLIDARSGEVKQEAECKASRPGITDATPLSGPVVFSKDGKRLLIGDTYSTLSWDFKTNKVTPARLQVSLGVRGVLADGKSVLGLDYMQNIRMGGGPKVFGGKIEKPNDPAIVVCDLATGKLVRGFCHSALAGGVLAPDGKTVVTFARNTARLELWDVATGKRGAECDTKIVPETVEYKEGNKVVVAQMGGIFDASFTADGRFVACCLGTGEIGYVHIFDAQSGLVIASAKVAYCPLAVALARDGTKLAVAGGVGPLNLSVWDVTGLPGPATK